MKKEKILLLLFLGSAAFVSCNRVAEKQEDVKLTMEEYNKNQTSIKSETIQMKDSLCDPTIYQLVRDSLILVFNQPHCDYLMEFYSLNSGKIVAQVAHVGQGPDELNSCTFLERMGDSILYVRDQSFCYKLSIDRMLKTGRLSPLAKFKLSPDAHTNAEICMLGDSKYVAYNIWYLDNTQYNNKVPMLNIYNINDESGHSMGELPYFVAPVNGAHLFRVPQTGRIWVADMHKDKIEIKDDSLKTVRTIEGPDYFAPKYKLADSSAPIKFVSFQGDKECRAYSSFCVTSRHVYLVYEGNEKFDMEHLQPVKISKFDLDGNFICSYKTDRYILSISVDKDEKYLYATSRTSAQSQAVFVKYKL